MTSAKIEAPDFMAMATPGFTKTFTYYEIAVISRYHFTLT